MKTVHDNASLAWHLENNVQPPLSKNTIEQIMQTVDAFNSGNIKLSSPIKEGFDVTVAEMLEDLHIEIE